MDIDKAKEICRKEITNTYAEGKAKAIETVLSELDKKDKIIDAMAEEYSLKTDTNVLDICACCRYNNEDCHGDYCKEALINYFTKKVKEN